MGSSNYMLLAFGVLLLATYTNAFFDVKELCEKLQSEEICDGVQKAASILKIDENDVQTFVKDIASKGADNVGSFIKARLESELTNKSCDGDDKSECKEIRDIVMNVTSSGKWLKNSIKSAIAVGKEHIGKIYEKALEGINNAVSETPVSFDDFLADLHTNNDTTTSESSFAGSDDLLSLRNVLFNVFDKTTSIMRSAIGKLIILLNERMLNMKRSIQLIIEKQMRDMKELKDSSSQGPTFGYSSDRYDDIINDFDDDEDNFDDEMDDMISDLDYSIGGIIDPDGTHTKNQKNRVILETVVEHLTKAFREVAGKSGRIIKDIRNTMKKTGNKMIDISKIVFDNVVEIVEQLKKKGVFQKKNRLMGGLGGGGRGFPSTRRERGDYPSSTEDDAPEIDWTPKKRRGGGGGRRREERQGSTDDWNPREEARARWNRQRPRGDDDGQDGRRRYKHEDKKKKMKVAKAF